MDRQTLCKDIQAVLALSNTPRSGKDTGTYNMDSPAIRISGLKESQVRAVVEQAGGHTWVWEFMGNDMFVIDFWCQYSGRIRTQIAEEMAEELKRRGYETCMYYHMD